MVSSFPGYRGGAIAPAMIGAPYPMAAAQPLASYGLAGFGANTLSMAAAHAVQATAQVCVRVCVCVCACVRA